MDDTIRDFEVVDKGGSEREPNIAAAMSAFAVVSCVSVIMASRVSNFKEALHSTIWTINLLLYGELPWICLETHM